MKTRWILGSAMAVVGLVACGSGADNSEPVTLDTAAQLSALEVNQDGNDAQMSDATDDAPQMDRDCSLSGARKRLLAQYDTNKDGQLTGAELTALRADFGDVHMHPHHALRNLRKKLLVELYDDNQDGTLDDAERKNLERDLEARCENRKAQLLTKYDANHDGQLDDGEWLTFEQDVVARWKAKHAAVLAEFDSNKDGKLEAAERQNARQTLRQRLEDQWMAQESAHDTNADGHLQDAERSAFVAEFRLHIRTPS